VAEEGIVNTDITWTSKGLLHSTAIICTSSHGQYRCVGVSLSSALRSIITVTQHQS